MAVAVALSGCSGAKPADRAGPAPAGTLALRLPDRFGPLQRAPALFDHDAHTKALEKEGCQACHEATEPHGIALEFVPAREAADRDALTERYHARCMDCHKKRSEREGKFLPLACGECHVRRAPRDTAWTPIVFDSSLHARHVSALQKGGEKPCKTCHMVPDEKTHRLTYIEGKEATCATCHGPADRGKQLSLRHAAHEMCAGCHVQRRSRGETAGPTACKGCHDAADRAGIKTLERVPRLEGRQKDASVIQRQGSGSPAVVFDHKAHEAQSFCTSCHHKNQDACGTCHTLDGDEKGGGIRLVDAFHGPASDRGCVGCHRRETAKTECAGCHGAMGPSLSERTCDKCHTGPTQPGEPVTPAALPAPSKDFPEQVTLASLARKYEPSKFPHLKVATALDKAVRQSRLAARFHGDVNTLCAGCHHHSPVGKRPPPCRECHAGEPRPAVDQPGLMAAYHRQCLGCHVRMGVKKTGCTDCHALAPKEVAR